MPIDYGDYEFLKVEVTERVLTITITATIRRRRTR